MIISLASTIFPKSTNIHCSLVLAPDQRDSAEMIPSTAIGPVKRPSETSHPETVTSALYARLYNSRLAMASFNNVTVSFTLS